MAPPSTPGRGHDATGRSTARLRSKRDRTVNQPPSGEPWTILTRAMIESPAWRELSRAGLQVIFRLMSEHMAHGGQENGRLPCTFDDFARYGVRRKSVAGATSATRRAKPPSRLCG